MSPAKRGYDAHFATKNTSSFVDPVTKHKICLVFPVSVRYADADEPDDDFEPLSMSTGGYIPIDKISAEMVAPGFFGEPEDGEASDSNTETGYAAPDPLDILIAREEAEAEVEAEAYDPYAGDPMEQTTPEDDLIHFGQSSCERPGVDRSDRGSDQRNDRRGPRQMVTRRRRSSKGNHESHCPKYGRQDERHHLPRIEAKNERREAEYKRQYLLLLEHNPEDDFLSLCAEMSDETQFYYGRIEQQQERFMDWHNDIAYEAYDVVVFNRYDRNRDEALYSADADFDLWLRDGYYPDWDDYGGCHCRFCKVIDNFCDDGEDVDDSPYDPFDIFQDYGFAHHVLDMLGLADDTLDILSVGHSSRPRFTGRYHHSRGPVTPSL